MKDKTSDNDKSLGSIFTELAEEVSSLVRSEIALAKLELKEAATTVGGAAAMFAVALFLAMFGIGFLAVTAVLALATVIPAWLSSLVIAVVLFLVAVILVLSGKRRLSRVNLMPTGTIESVKADLESIKDELSRARRG